MGEHIGLHVSRWSFCLGVCEISFLITSIKQSDEKEDEEEIVCEVLKIERKIVK